jgi:hypothetical protein
MTLETSTETCILPSLGERIGAAGIVVQGSGATIRRELVCPQPALAQHDRVGRQAAHVLDETRKMKGDLRIGRPIGGVGRRDRLRLAEVCRPGRPRA